MMPFVSHRIPFGLNLWIAARLLPVFARRPLDEILARATPDPGAQAYGGLSPLTIVAEVKRAVAKPMRMRGRRCLREGLLAFHYLSLAGYRPILHFGLVPQTITTQHPQAHCWVTVNDVTVMNPPTGPMIDLFAYDGSAALAANDATLAGRLMTERATYDFCGAGLRLEAEDAEIAAMFGRGFGGFIAGDDRSFATPPFTLRIGMGEPVVAEDLPLVWEGTFPEGGSGRLFESEERCVLDVIGACVLDIAPASRQASVALAPGGGRRFMGSASMLLLDFVLLAGGQHLVHAACLTRQKAGDAILVCGPSGRGKTTTAIALSRGGFGLMTDDAGVIAFGQDSVRAWGLPRGLKVHRHTAALMPWLSSLLGETWDGSGEQGLPLRDVAGYLDLAKPTPVPLEAVIVLGNRSAGGHVIEPVPKSAALLEIAADNIAWYASGAPQRSAQMFEALGRTLATVPTYRLHAGPDLDALPSFLERFLDRAPARLAPP